MLRCSHAASLRTRFERSVVLRLSVNPPLPRASRRFLFTAPPASGPATLRTLIVGTRGYSTTAEEKETSVEDDGIPPSFRVDAQKQPKHRRQHEDLLLKIAMSQSPYQETGKTSVSRKVVESELKWLQDPRALADRVGRMLNTGNVTLAVEVVRAAQKDQMECAVAWNHLLEHCMKKGSPRAAFRFFNEMKKRGRKPNSMTYTIMLNGLSNTGKYLGINPVRTALSIYRSIFAPSSTVEPHIIHTNAMLSVCMRHGDMDTLWQVSGELPEVGIGSPDSFTYTIILKAITGSMQRELATIKTHETEKIFIRRAQAVKEGKRVWSDIVYRWKKGELLLDERLISAMALVLLEGTGDRHFYEVFELFHQTTGLPILARAPLPDEIKEKQTWNPRENNEVEDVPFVDEEGRLYRVRQPEPEAAEEEEKEDEETFEKLFEPILFSNPLCAGEPHAAGDTPIAPTYVPIGNRILTLTLGACQYMTLGLSIGKAYWGHLTKEEHGYRIDPDAESFHQYLRLLRVGRSSRVAVELLREQMVPAGIADGKAFHIAMSACRRDRRNINILNNAHQLLKLMDTSLVLPDPRALKGYLKLVQNLEDNPQILVSVNGLEISKGRPSGNLGAIGRGLQMSLQSAAVENLRPLTAKLSEAMEHTPVSPAVATVVVNGNDKEQKVDGGDALKVLTRTRMLIDSILRPLNEGLLSKSARKQYEKESIELRKYSKPEIIEKFRSGLISPTANQILTHRKHSQNDEELSS